ncbi:MAG: hypothetical protein Q9170_004922 [Blastenia crenularia]
MTTNEMDLDQTQVERDATLLASAISKDEEQAKVVGWMKKTWWTVLEKKIVEKLVRDFEKWIKRLRQLIELAWSPLPFLTSLSQLQNLEKDHDAEKVGLLNNVPLRKLIVAPADTQTFKVENLRIATSGIFAWPMPMDPNYGYLRSGKGDGVYMEYKSYDVSEANATREVAFNRIHQLIALLHEAKDARFKVLRCVNYFDNWENATIGIVFELPPHLGGRPRSLLDVLSCSASSRPSLDDRMRLARSLAETLILLHSVGWLHKSIRSETVLLLISRTKSPSHDDVPDLQHPRLTGFEYSRLDNEMSFRHSDFELQHNIYRHPDRWNQPNITFSKIHDIYSLGVVLLGYRVLAAYYRTECERTAQ